MKSDDSFPEIGKLLRSRKPDPQPSPGLELRILRSLNRPARRRVWPWFVLPPALAMGVFLMAPNRDAKVAPATVETDDPPAVEIPIVPERPDSLALHGMNPLQQETRALQRDAERAGRFLIDCLPSFSAVPR